jgi:hypothetical protein
MPSMEIATVLPGFIEPTPIEVPKPVTPLSAYRIHCAMCNPTPRDSRRDYTTDVSRALAFAIHFDNT